MKVRVSLNSTELMRREILRLARATSRSAFIHPRRLSRFYNVPEKSVRQELAKLAAENHIRLAACHNNEEFITNATEGAAIKVDLVD
jgi:hypothetical protein